MMGFGVIGSKVFLEVIEGDVVVVLEMDDRVTGIGGVDFCDGGVDGGMVERTAWEKFNGRPHEQQDDKHIGHSNTSLSLASE